MAGSCTAVLAAEVVAGSCAGGVDWPGNLNPNTGATAEAPDTEREWGRDTDPEWALPVVAWVGAVVDMEVEEAEADAEVDTGTAGDGVGLLAATLHI